MRTVGHRCRAGHGWEVGGYLPQVWDASEAVSSLRVPHTHVACQATAHQQHPITGQTLDVLREHSMDMGTGAGVCAAQASGAPSSHPCSP